MVKITARLPLPARLAFGVRRSCSSSCSKGQRYAKDEIRLRQAYGATGFMGHMGPMSSP